MLLIHKTTARIAQEIMCKSVTDRTLLSGTVTHSVSTQNKTIHILGI